MLVSVIQEIYWILEKKITFNSISTSFISNSIYFSLQNQNQIERKVTNENYTWTIH